LLSPFHYFGVTDNVDLSQVHWVAGNYDERELENLYVFERAVGEKRVGDIISAMERYCLDPAEIIGIGFCLSKKHAEFMAKVFNKAGIPTEFLIAESGDDVRDSVKRRLVTKEITFVFVVDIIAVKVS
jgi:superfamily II DNA or RNA helicase